MTKIVILDGYLINPGDLDWKPFHELGHCAIYDRSSKDTVIERCQEAEIVITNKVRLGENEFRELPKLKYIGEAATGFDNIDVAAANKRNIVVTNVPAYSTPSTAQHTIALLLEVCNQVGFHNKAVQSNEWVRSPDFAFYRTALIELKELNLGIFGFGAIGHSVANIAHALGMKILVNNRSPIHKTSFDVKQVDRDTLFRESDVLSLHCPLTQDTAKIINRTTLDLMKPTAILINAARGGLIDEEALAEALKSGKIRAAALDVLTQEPAAENCPLLNLDNCFITPHNAWASTASRKRLLNTLVDNLRHFLAGKPKNVVAPKQ